MTIGLDLLGGADEPERSKAAKAAQAQSPDDELRLGDDDRVVLCAACDQLITDQRQRIRVQDAHEHRFMNPAGELFHIGCFALAIGCRVIGPDSWEYPWFPGFAWRFADCGGCGRQLGWCFRDSEASTGAPTSFFGLVLDRLRFASRPG